MVLYNVRAQVVEEIEAESPQAAHKLLTDRLIQAGYEPLDYTPLDVFVSENNR
jgi:hypothetical protein